jgi:hypothetical protein
MTQAYRCDETAIENQNDSKISLEKKRISFTKNFSACDSCDSLSSVDGATKDQPHGAACADANIDHANRTTRSASRADNVFERKALSAIRILLYGDACFDCMT